MQSTLKFISIRRKYGHKGEQNDQASLAIDSKYNAPGYVQVVGGLNHCTQIAPVTESDRLAMIAWLESEDCKNLVKNS